jgi:hypothetical protein
VPRSLHVENETPSTIFVREPAVTLARREPPTVAFDLLWPPASLNRVDGKPLLHVAYALSREGWLAAVAVDEAGQELETSAWKMAGGVPEWGKAAKKVWRFIEAMTERRDVEWRVVLTRMGQFQAEELQGELWCSCSTQWI